MSVRLKFTELCLFILVPIPMAHPVHFDRSGGQHSDDATKLSCRISEFVETTGSAISMVYPARGN